MKSFILLILSTLVFSSCSKAPKKMSLVETVDHITSLAQEGEAEAIVDTWLHTDVTKGEDSLSRQAMVDRLDQKRLDLLVKVLRSVKGEIPLNDNEISLDDNGVASFRVDGSNLRFQKQAGVWKLKR